MPTKIYVKACINGARTPDAHPNLPVTPAQLAADALAVHGKFDGLFTQGGSTGSVRALMDAKHPFIPMAGEGENGFRKAIAEHKNDGLKGFSYGQSPALVAIAIKAAMMPALTA